MILENSIERHGYAVVLLQQAHPFTVTKPDSPSGFVRLTTAWSSCAIEEIQRRLSLEVDFLEDDVPFNVAFPGFDEAYAYDYADYNFGGLSSGTGDLIMIQANEEDHAAIFERMANAASDPPSGDDSTFDYWPSEFGCLVAYAHDLKALFDTNYYIEACRLVWDKVSQAIDGGDDGEWMTDEVTMRP